MGTTSFFAGHLGFLELVVNTTLSTPCKSPPPLSLQSITAGLILIGKHCCLWCHITSGELSAAPSVRGTLQLRSGITLAADLAAFKADGSNIKKAKFFHNVIREPMFAISIDQACKLILISTTIHVIYFLDLPPWSTHHPGHLLQTFLPP